MVRWRGAGAFAGTSFSAGGLFSFDLALAVAVGRGSGVARGRDSDWVWVGVFGQVGVCVSDPST